MHFASFAMRLEFADDRGDASGLQPGLEFLQSRLSRRLVRAKLLQGLAHVFGRVPEVENSGYLLAGEELLAHVEDPRGSVRNHHQLLGLAQPGPCGFSLQPRGGVRVAAHAAYGGGAVDAAAPGLAAGSFSGSPVSGCLLSAEWTTKTFASRI